MPRTTEDRIKKTIAMWANPVYRAKMMKSQKAIGYRNYPDRQKDSVVV